MPIQLQSAAGTSANTQPLIFTTGTSGSYTIQFPATNGTVNQVLRNNGSGVLTFQALGAAAPVGFTSSAVGVITASGGSTNQSVAIIARGTGSIQNMIPNGAFGPGSGNPPGDNCWQLMGPYNAIGQGFTGSRNISFSSFSGTTVTIGSAVSQTVNIFGRETKITSGSNSVLINDPMSLAGRIVTDSFIAPRSYTGSVNETTYFSYQGPCQSGTKTSVTGSFGGGVGPHLLIGSNISAQAGAGFDCPLPNASTGLLGVITRYAAFGCVTTSNTLQYMVPNGALTTAAPAAQWGSIPRILDGSATAKQIFAYGSVIAMTAGGAQYKIWRFYQLQDNVSAAQGAITVIANSAGAAGWTLANATGTLLSGMTFSATGGVVDTIRWFGSCWVLEAS